MLDSKLEPQPGEGSGDNNCSMPRNKIPHDEGSGVEVHLSHLQADDPGSGVALANADRERLDNHDDGSRDNSISMVLNTMPPDGHLVQAGESGDPYSHLKRPGDSKNHVRTTVSKTADCGNDKKQARRTSSPSRHDIACPVLCQPMLQCHQYRTGYRCRIG